MENNKDRSGHDTSEIQYLQSGNRRFESEMCNINGKHNLDTNESSDTDENQRKKAKKWQTWTPPILPPCRVCGAKASGLHYGVNTCEACKGFFRRNIKRGAIFQCVKQGNCEISSTKRSCCTACRFKKCLQLGMSKEAIKTGRYPNEKKTEYITEVKKLEEEESKMRMTKSSETFMLDKEHETTVSESDSGYYSNNSPDKVHSLGDSPCTAQFCDSPKTTLVTSSIDNTQPSDLGCIRTTPNINLDTNRFTNTQNIMSKKNQKDSNIVNYTNINHLQKDHQDLSTADTKGVHVSVYSDFENTTAKTSLGNCEMPMIHHENGMSDSSPPPSMYKISEDKAQEYEALIKEIEEAYLAGTPYPPDVLASLPEKQAKYKEGLTLKERMFGPLKPIPIEEYRQIYHSTGIDIDGRKETIATLIPCIENAIKKFISFAKKMPGFKTLPLNDQIALVKASRFDCWMLTAHQGVNIQDRLYTNHSGITISWDELLKLDTEEFLNDMFNFSEKMKVLKLSITEIALLEGMCILASDRCSLEDRTSAEAHRQNLGEALMYHLHQHYPGQAQQRYAHFSNLLTQLRSIKHSRTETEMRFNEWGNELQPPPLLIEMWCQD